MPQFRLFSSSSASPRRRNRGRRPTSPSNRPSPAPGRRRQDHPAFSSSRSAPDIATPGSPPPRTIPVSLPVINRSSLPPLPAADPSPPVDWPMINQGSSSTDSSTASPVDWPLVDPKPIPDGIELGNGTIAGSATHGDRSAGAIAIAYTSRRLKVTICFQSWGGTLALDTRWQQMSDPCTACPIKILSEVICSHYQLVLLGVCSTAINSPRDFFVYSFPYMGEDASVHRIPKFLPQSSAVSHSFGLLRDQSDCDKYVVANLEMLNPKKGYVEVLLHRWWPSSESWSSRFLEKVTLPSIIDMRKWQTDQVIAYHDELFWADLKQGILFCFKNPLEKDTELRIIYLPRIPHAKSMRRPETFMTVGCSNGKLKFVHLDISDFSEVVTIMTFSESSYKKKELCWHKTSRIYLNCTELWANMPLNLEVSEYHMPCFPVLHTDKDNIVYLTISKKDKDNKCAWLLQVDMKARKDSKGASPHQVDTESDTSTEFDTQFSTDSDTSTESSMEYWALVGVIDYPGFCRHQKPPLVLLQD